MKMMKQKHTLARESDTTLEELPSVPNLVYNDKELC